MSDPKIRILAEAAYLVGKQVTFENYQNIIDHSDYFDSLKKQKYECLAVKDNEQDGFYAVAFGNRNQEILVALRGTDFYNFNFLPLAQPITSLIAKVLLSCDLYNDLQIALGEIPEQYESAEDFIRNLVTTYPCRPMVITGHSLGGLLSQLVAVKFGIEAVVFDSPGAKKMIAKLVGEKIASPKITIINDLPNFINTRGEHIKVPIVLNNGGALTLNVIRNFLGTMPHKPGKKAKYLCSHGMEDILNSINENGFYKTIPIKTWPKNSISFYKTREAYNAMPEIYDTCIYEMWQKHNKGFLKTKSASFEVYKENLLRREFL